METNSVMTGRQYGKKAARRRKRMVYRVMRLAKKARPGLETRDVQEQPQKAGDSSTVPLLSPLPGASQTILETQDGLNNTQPQSQTVNEFKFTPINLPWRKETAELQRHPQNLSQFFNPLQISPSPTSSIITSYPPPETQSEHTTSQRQLPLFSEIKFTPINPPLGTPKVEEELVHYQTTPPVSPLASKVTGAATKPRERIKVLRRKLKAAAQKFLPPGEINKELERTRKQLEDFDNIETVSLLPHLIEDLARPKAKPVSRLLKVCPSSIKKGDGSLRFAGSIVQESKVVAKCYAMDEYKSRGRTLGRIAYWADASSQPQGAGVAFAFKDDPGCLYSIWTLKGYRVVQRIENNYAELLAVLLAMEHVEARAVAFRGSIQAVAIYTDSTNALYAIKNFGRTAKFVSKFSPLAERVIRLSHSLSSLGITVELHWVPGHAGVPGNVVADRVAFWAARKAV